MIQKNPLYIWFILACAGMGLLFPGWGVAQQEGNNWYFGKNSGIRFQDDSVLVLTDGQLNREEGCATVSDDKGNLLFYTDGVDVWNRQHQILLNGGGISGYISNSQVLIAPLPGSDSIYYIFTTVDDDPASPQLGFRYAIVDMSRDGGLGEVISKGNFLFSNSTEKVCMTRAENGVDLWVLAHEKPDSTFRAYRLTCNGLDTNYVASEVGSPITFTNGYMKFSHDGRKIAMTFIDQNIVQLFDFDNGSGTVSGPITLTGLENAYGVEFSPNNTLLYVSCPGSNGKIYQYDLSNWNETAINASGILIPSSFFFGHGAAQLGPDGKIYINNSSRYYLSVIEHPDSLFPACGFIEEGITFWATDYVSGLSGLPHLYPPKPTSMLSILPQAQICEGDSIWFTANHLYVPDSTLWKLEYPDSGMHQTFSGDSLTISFPNHGVWGGQLLSYWGCETDTQYFSITVTSSPEVQLPDSFFICGTEPVTLSPTSLLGATSIQWSTLDTTPDVTVQDPGEYWVKVSNQCGVDSTETVVIQDDEDGVFIPNVFTPNGDGINDLYRIEVKNQEGFLLQIFDRWGRMVFKSSNPDILWNGNNYQGGLYYYLLMVKDCKGEKKEFKGGFSLIR